MKLRLGTRGSRLALAQSNGIKSRLEALGHEVVLQVIQTQGDLHRDVAFENLGAAGIFVRSLEQALVRGEVDLAVHSYKDLPSDSPSELTVAAVPERRDPADLLLVRADAVDRSAPGPLPLFRGARVGTAAARRRALLLDMRPDLEVGTLRGNVPTRLRKLQDGEHDAIVLAAAGIDRLAQDLDGERSGLLELRLDPERFVPAPSQGALALQVRRDDPAASAVAVLNDADVYRCVQAERLLLERMDAGCHVAFGAWCRSTEEGLRMNAIFGGREMQRGLRRASGLGCDPERLAREVWEQLK
ncbi:MAG: hydroxymethylbilane synthase [Thermoanaerobaculia bacterium]|nr:hydroxymethylbilane synthase [Thermoanaerobaculia bacterium]